MDPAEIAGLFDARAAKYVHDRWHQRYADTFVAALPLRPGDIVLDAGAGTGFAAIPIARRVAPGGRVLAVDLSAGMLERARAAVRAEGLDNVQLLQADATNLPDIQSGSFDVVVCSAGLLYMPIARALREWFRLLKPRGIVAFSTMQEDSPSAGRLFRRCATDFGLEVHDHSQPLGTVGRCRDALTRAGFDLVEVLPVQIAFDFIDPQAAWEANLKSAGHAAARALPPERQEELRRRYVDALQQALKEDLAAASQADVLFAIGRRPATVS